MATTMDLTVGQAWAMAIGYGDAHRIVAEHRLTEGAVQAWVDAALAEAVRVASRDERAAGLAEALDEYRDAIVEELREAAAAAAEIDPTHEGITLAEEAVRDIARERGLSRQPAARAALDEGVDAWSRGVIPEALWPEVLAAAESHLRALSGGR